MEDREFVVYRHGWNAANQPSASCPHKMEVARVTAPGPDRARELAAQRVTVYNNQFLSAEDAAEVGATEDDVDSRVKLV